MKNTLYILISLISCLGYSQIIPSPIRSCDNDSFNLKPGDKYVVSAWVKEAHEIQQITYTSTVNVTFASASFSFTPSGKIIEGWQKITGIFTIPDTHSDTYIDIGLANSNSSGGETYFDDIRVAPFNSNLKSFVYDPVTQQLMAELDENNYATFYEYDIEGGLIRVKKETEIGVVTIQETRSGNSKISE